MNHDLLILFVGIIAACMVVITLVIALIGLHAIRLMQKLQEFMYYAQSEFGSLGMKAAVTLQEINNLLIHPKEQSGSISDKSLSALHEIRELVTYIHEQTKDLALKASNGIAKVTIGSLAIGALSQIFKKQPHE